MLVVFFCLQIKGKNYRSEVNMNQKLILLRSDQLATLRTSPADKNILDLENINLKKYCICWQTDIGDDD